jgi:ribonuclease-3 family protein
MNYPSLTLAFIGDAYFELLIREHFIKKGVTKVNILQNKTSKYASAIKHKEIMDFLLENNLLSEEEIIVYKRGRNAKVNQKRKNFNPENYHASTGFEAVIGFLYMNKEYQRIIDIISIILERFED